MGSPSRNVQYHPPRLSEDRLNLPQPHSPSLPTHCTAPGNRECALLDPVLGVPAGAVDLLVEETRRLPHVGHDEARIVPRLAVSVADDFGLDHHAARVVPRAGLVLVGLGVDVLGLFAAPRPRPRHQHGRLGVPLQHRVLRHRDHVIEPRLRLQEGEDRRAGKAPVEPNENARPRKRPAQPRQQPRQQPDRPLGGDRLAVPQQRRAQILLGFAVEGQEAKQRQVAPVVVVAVEERVLLRPVRRVVRRVQIDRDAPRPPVQTAAMPLDDPRGQLVGHAVERAAVDCVLEPRQRRLRRQALARNRVSVEQQLVDRVLGETVAIIAVGMAAGDAKDALADQVRERVTGLVRRPLVEQTPGERLDQAVDALGGLQQDRPAVGTGLLLVEPGEQRLVKQIREQNSLWYSVGRHARASVVAQVVVNTALVPHGGSCVCTGIGTRHEFSGASVPAETYTQHLVSER